MSLPQTVMKIYVPNYYQAGGANERGVSTDRLEVYDDQGTIVVDATGSRDIQITWTQSSFVPSAGSNERLWNVEMSLSLDVTDPMSPLAFVFTMPYPIPIVPDVPVVGYFTTVLRTTSLNAQPYWSATNGANDKTKLILTFSPTPDILGQGSELVYVNLTLATRIVA